MLSVRLLFLSKALCRKDHEDDDADDDDNHGDDDDDRGDHNIIDSTMKARGKGNCKVGREGEERDDREKEAD